MRRQKLLAGLELLLRDKALADIQIVDIATAAGVQRSAFYFYYATKFAAVADLLLTIADELLEGGERFFEAETEDGLRQAFGTLIAGWNEHRHLFAAMAEARGQDPEVRDLWSEWLERFLAPVAETIARARAGGRASDGPSPELLARLLLDLNERALDRHMTDPVCTDEELRDALVRLWQAAIYGAASG